MFNSIRSTIVVCTKNHGEQPEIRPPVALSCVAAFN